MSVIQLKVITPERTLVDEEVAEVILPTKTGQIAILPNHMPLIAEIEPGDIVIRSKNSENVTLVYGGFVYVKEKSQVLILADSAEHLHELNETEILEAKKRAEAAKEAAIGNKELLAESEAEIARITTQLRSITRHSGIKRHRGKDFKDL